MRLSQTNEQPKAAEAEELAQLVKYLWAHRKSEFDPQNTCELWGMISVHLLRQADPGRPAWL